MKKIRLTSMAPPDSGDGCCLPTDGDPGGEEIGSGERRIAQLIVGDVELVSVQVLVVAQRAPRQGVVFLAHPEEAAEAHHRIGGRNVSTIVRQAGW
jgi:hypothetical protein